MKWMNRIFMILVFVGAAITVKGQGKMRFSVHADPQFAWLSSDDKAIDPDGSIFHLQAGLLMDYYFAENYAFSIGFGINNLGGKLYYADSTAYDSKGDTLWIVPDQRLKMNLQHIDIPLGLKLKTEELGYATFFLQAGFNLMFNINAHVTADDQSLEKESIQESVRVFNLGYHVGAGVEYRLGGSTAAFGGVRWSSCLLDVTPADAADLTMNAISINLGILF
jgi:hypothetical protein